MQTEPQKQPASLASYLGLGCGALVLLAVVGVLVLVGLFRQKRDELIEDLSNPTLSAQKTRKMLGASTLPPGYHAMVSVSIPMVLDTAMLTNRSPEVPERFQPDEERMFFYMYLKTATKRDLEALRAYMEGQTQDPSALRRHKIYINPREVIHRGPLGLPGRSWSYLAVRGELQSGQKEMRGQGLLSIVFMQCPDKPQLHLGVWIAPDPAPEEPLRLLNLEGTPADEQALRAFMSHLDPCQAH